VPNGLFPGRAAGGRGGCGTFVILEGVDEGVDGGIDGEIVCGSSGIFFSTAGISTSLFLATVFLGAAFFTGLSSAGLFTGGYLSRNFLTTGGSTVEDAERTNSPISWSLARTSLLSMPTSFANS
jgi:hypothetical protein